MNRPDSEFYERLSREAADRVTDTGRYLKRQWRRRTPEQQEGIIAGGAVIVLAAILVGSYMAGLRAADRFRDIADKRSDDDPSG